MAKNKKNTYSWMNPKLEIRSASKYGKNEKGVFAKKNIVKDETLFVMSGYILTNTEEYNLPESIFDDSIEVSEYFSFSPRKESDVPLMPQHYVNHGCNPNAGFRDTIFMVAMRNIEKGEEICYDYAMLTLTNDDGFLYLNMKCLCGSKKCRKIITNEDWEIPELHKRYKGYFQTFVQRNIDILNGETKKKVIKNIDKRADIFSDEHQK